MEEELKSEREEERKESHGCIKERREERQRKDRERKITFVSSGIQVLDTRRRTHLLFIERAKPSRLPPLQASTSYILNSSIAK